MKTMRQLGFLACSLLTLAACSSGNSSDPLPSTGQENKKLPININTSVNTRVIDNSFEQGDDIGLSTTMPMVLPAPSRLQAIMWIT